MNIQEEMKLIRERRKNGLVLVIGCILVVLALLVYAIIKFVISAPDIKGDVENAATLVMYHDEAFKLFGLLFSTLLISLTILIGVGIWFIGNSRKELTDEFKDYMTRASEKLNEVIEESSRKLTRNIVVKRIFDKEYSKWKFDNDQKLKDQFEEEFKKKVKSVDADKIVKEYFFKEHGRNLDEKYEDSMNKKIEKLTADKIDAKLQNELLNKIDNVVDEKKIQRLASERSIKKKIENRIMKRMTPAWVEKELKHLSRQSNIADRAMKFIRLGLHWFGIKGKRKTRKK